METLIVKQANVRILLTGFREIASMVIAVIEDYLGTPLDKSLLANRREKVK